MDYLGWELERQRAALRALLGGGETEEGEAFSGEEPSDWGGPSGWDGSVSAEGTRRSPEGLGKARGRGSGRTGRYAAGRGEAGGPLIGAPGAWEMVREADRAALAKGLDGPPVSAELQSGEAGSPARGRRSRGTGARPFSRRYAPEEMRRTSRIGTGGTAELRGFSGGQRDYEEEWETADGTGAEAAVETAGGRRAGDVFAERGPALEAGGAPSPGGSSGGGGAAGDAPTPMSRDGAGMVRPVRDGLAGAAGPGERLSRTLPWGEGWESPALRAEDGAKALSRAVQRDARRYDGGFTIY